MIQRCKFRLYRSDVFDVSQLGAFTKKRRAAHTEQHPSLCIIQWVYMQCVYAACARISMWRAGVPIGCALQMYVADMACSMCGNTIVCMRSYMRGQCRVDFVGIYITMDQRHATYSASNVDVLTTIHRVIRNA
jgi:hypothetical protein